jgi:hypothetical protein
MSALPPGEVTLKRIAQEFGLRPDTMKKLATVLRDATSPLTKRLAELGVSYAVSGAGRKATSFLLKRPV